VNSAELAGLFAGLILVAAGSLVLWSAADCRPRVLALRASMRLHGTDEAPARAAALRALVPDGIDCRLDLRYDTGDRDALLDIFRPAEAQALLPAIVWVHGGAWIGGTKNDMREYLQILAGYGFVAVGVEYSHAPRRKYPTPARQVNAALDYLTGHAAALGIDACRLVLAGDSAGAQIAAQVAAASTDPGYAREAGLHASLRASQLRGVVLMCGAYDLTARIRDGGARRVSDTLLWAYSGKKHYWDDPVFAYASVARHVSAAFPPSLISAGNGDPLLRQSQRMAAALTELDVPVETLFFDGHQPPLPHEYHLDLPRPGAQFALGRIVAHVSRHTADPVYGGTEHPDE
jgi:acetyl esterase